MRASKGKPTGTARWTAVRVMSSRGAISTLASVVLAAALGVSPHPAGAQTSEGVYVGLNAGLNLNDSGSIGGGPTGSGLETDPGVTGIGALGYAFGNGLRVELEGGYRRNGVDKWGDSSVDGSLSAWSAMVNALYDIDTGSAVSPYVGGGVGAAFVTADLDVSGTTNDVDDTSPGVAYQAIAGMAYAVTDDLAVNLDYRFFHALDLEHDISGGGKASHDHYMNHAVTAGVRYTFGQPESRVLPPPEAPPVAAAPPPPEIPTSYLVFFTNDSADLSGEAARIVDTAAGNALSANRTRIEVTGHTDTTGTERYNMVLSQRRAETVMRRLISQGIPADQIAVFAYGESQPMIPTPDGVSEAQNRRVEIILL